MFFLALCSICLGCTTSTAKLITRNAVMTSSVLGPCRAPTVVNHVIPRLWPYAVLLLLPPTVLDCDPSLFAQVPEQQSQDVSLHHAISSVFNPGFVVDGYLPDLEVISPDGVHFHVHTRRLLASSSNAFGGTLAHPTYPLYLPETSVVLSIVFHVIYGMSVLPHPPPLQSTEAALDALIKYGLSTAQLAAPTLPLYELVRSYAPYYPIEAYALAAHYHLEDLAVAISAHLLAYDVTRLSDELTVKMGPIYFARLVNLQRGRISALRNIVLRPPAMHPATPTCNADNQRELSRAWAFANAEIVWNVLPNISTYALESTFLQSAASVTCPDCQVMLRTRIQEVKTEWSSVKWLWHMWLPSPGATLIPSP
ncbi:hypothetical protein C8Q73DRAFT_787744 [Cubamyces lactineus]|nr:hypothetical protein C8Q73DRAFT_787744 [Cubamyces lactineus]